MGSHLDAPKSGQLHVCPPPFLKCFAGTDHVGLDLSTLFQKPLWDLGAQGGSARPLHETMRMA